MNNSGAISGKFGAPLALCWLIEKSFAVQLAITKMLVCRMKGHKVLRLRGR